MKTIFKKNYINLFFLLIFLSVICLNFVSAGYSADVFFTVPTSVYNPGERIELKGSVNLTNSSSAGGNTTINISGFLVNANVNISIRNTSVIYVVTTNLTTDSNGVFYTKSNFFPNATQINASNFPGKYYIRAEYKDPNNGTWFSEVQIMVINQTMDFLSISTEKARYNPLELVLINAEAVRLVGDTYISVSNVSINGSLRNYSKSVLQTFSCLTGTNGKCTVNLSAPSNPGTYIVELDNFKAYSSFLVFPFLANVYMKDELGKALKNIYALGEQGRVDVNILNASSSDIYTFSGYITDSRGNNIKLINSTVLNNNNSFSNGFLFTLDAITFSYGSYAAYVTVAKTGDGSITLYTSFEVEDWVLSVNKKSSNSGFEYEYSVFPNKTMRFEAYPTYRSNGSVVTGINASSFIINLKDNLNNIVASVNATWNLSCGKEGCYEFLLISPLNNGKYFLETSVSYNGAIQTDSQLVNVINGVMSGQSTDKDGNIKELFGTNEYVYLSLSSYNMTSSSVNLSDAEIFIVEYMNGSEFNYSQVNSFELVNSSNNNSEWAWNSSLQRLKLDAPKIGGLYDIYIFGNNRSLGANAKFIVNPYDVCAVSKDTAGTITAGSGYYYVWQFKTTDTVYFEMKITQANNPLGKASASNNSGNGSNTYGMGSACVVDTTKKQAITNATISVVEVKNLESGAIQNINSSALACQASDNSGTYTCTVKPLLKWDGGVNIVKFNIKGQDGTTGIVYSRFESRAFYLYGYSNTWQNSPLSNITLSVRIYEAGSNWWGTSASSGGKTGTVSVKRVEWMGRDGEYIWPPVNSGYNVSLTNSSTINSGTGTISLPASYAQNGSWKTGYYRIILQATTSSGDSDYGYAWFGVKLWDVYGNPVECNSYGCNYKSYFNSKENITLYVKISKAGDYSYSYSGGQDIWGNVTVGIKKIEDCRRWPCKELNSTQYTANVINVNSSSPWYWNSNITSAMNYLIYINSTTGTWNTGYYNVVLNVNGTDTGYAWFNSIAFYVETTPVNATQSYRYSIRGSMPMYFNVTTVKNYKNGFWYTINSTSYYSRYNETDYVNTSFSDLVLRTWDQQTWVQREYNYPEDLNVTPATINSTGLLNVSYLNGSWPTGYYNGELILRNSDNETSTGWLWFNVQPFRVDVNRLSSYETDSDSCVNITLSIYDSDWSSNALLYGNYSVISIVENFWSSFGMTTTSYSNFTNTSFNATTNVSVCPDNSDWGSGSWGGYHSLNILVRDNNYNDSQTGWLSFRAIPFRVSWSSGTGSNILSNQNIGIIASITKYSSGENTTANLTRISQWRDDLGINQEYVFSVGNCFSNVSRQCTVNGSQNITIYPPVGGWKIGYNYLKSEFGRVNSALTKVEGGDIYFNGIEAYNGWFSTYHPTTYVYKYNFAVNENITIALHTKDSNYNYANLTITSVKYAFSGSSCWTESCRVYTDAVFSPNSTAPNGFVYLQIQYPSSNWTRGSYYIKASVSGDGGIGTTTGGEIRVKDMIAPNVTLNNPVINTTYNNTSLLFNITTDEISQCSISIINYDNFYNWYCGAWNSTNLSNPTLPQKIAACNASLYNYNGSSYHEEHISQNYHSIYTGNSSSYSYSASEMITRGLSHLYTVNLTNMAAQHYGANIWCYDDDYNYGSNIVAFKVNVTGT